MTEKDLLIQDLRAENERLKKELREVKAKCTDFENLLVLERIRTDELIKLLGGGDNVAL